MDTEDVLSQLLTALAAGARALQGLPLGDEFEYQSSFPEFRQLLDETQSSLLEVLLTALGDDNLLADSLHDPLLWEACVDVCDSLLEQAETGAQGPTSDLVQARNQAHSTVGRLLKGIVDMKKPQDSFGLRSNSSQAFDRLRPFIPKVTEKYHAVTPLDLSLHPGHGIDTRFGPLRRVQVPKNIVAPSQHVEHLYKTEIEGLEYPSWQLDATEPDGSKIPQVAKGGLEATWVDTQETLQDLASQLELAKEVAIDIEAHSYRSFAGLTCLIQLTIGRRDEARNYLIDPFPLWNDIQSALGPTLANPAIVKVLHGADSDIQWLQRDFGLYVVNLFDTGRAARALKFSSAGYAFLLQHYVGITADKSHQLSDWRQRPLPDAMKEYAIMDTHYLLDIYDRLKYDLLRHETASIEEVLKDSNQVSLIRYVPEPFKPEGYKVLMNRRGTKTDLNEVQEQVLKELWDWRDSTARQNDESLAYVCTNNGLLRLALACPTTLAALQGLLQPIPPLVLGNAKHILGLVQRCVRPPFFKPATTDAEDQPGGSQRGLMSPVLGTEALYRQAGWISPYVDEGDKQDMVTTTDDDDDVEHEVSGFKPRRVLAVHESNQNYRSNNFSSHSLQLGDAEIDEHFAVDGNGPARAAHPDDLVRVRELQLSTTKASHTRNAQEHLPILGLISPPIDLDDDDEEDEEDDEEDEDTGERTAGEEIVIPRSMREIYRISNRNRRNKKSASPVPPVLNEKEAEELAKAEEILKARSLAGKSYFDEVPGSPKRQRTKSTGTASLSSEDTTPSPGEQSREEDVAMMQEVGWIKSKEEVENMMKNSDTDGEAADDGGEVSSDEEAMKSEAKSFDCSSVGAVGAFSSTPSPNPFFTGAALTGGPLNQQFGKPLQKKKQPQSGRSKTARRQLERPERSDGRSQTYKKR